MKERFRIGYVTQGAILFFVYFLLARWGLSFGAVSGVATAVWPPTGLAIVAIFFFGYRLWPAIALGAFLVNLSAGVSLYGAIGISLGNTLEALVGAYLLNRFDFRPSLSRVRDAMVLVFFGAILSTMVSAAIGVTSGFLSGTILYDEYFRALFTWWVGDMMGVLIFATLLFSWGSKFVRLQSFIRALEAIVCLTFLILANIVIFGGQFDQHFVRYLQPIFIFPFLIWAAVRFGPQGATLATCITAMMAIGSTTLQLGPFASDSLDQSLIYLVSFLVTLAATVLVLASSVAQGRAARSEDEAILASIGDGLIAMDQDEKIIFANPATSRILGLSNKDIVGKDDSAVLMIENEKAESVPEEERPLHHAMESGETIITTASEPLYIRRRDGTRLPVSITVTPIIQEKKIIGAIKVMRDVTQEKEIDRLKSEFVALTSHQLRTPLTGIEWTVDLFGKKEDLTPTGRKYLDDIRFSAKRLSTLVRLILHTSRIESGKISVAPSTFDLVDFIKKSLAEYNIIFERKKLKLIFQKHPAKLKVSTDKGILEYIFHNILMNAVDYTPGGGEVEVAVYKDEDKFLLSVRDTGIGIPIDDQKEIFKKFSRGSNAPAAKPEGTGLGLYIVSESVKLLRGRVWFETKEKKGSTFSVIIPLKN